MKKKNWSLRNSMSSFFEIPHKWNQYGVELSIYYHLVRSITLVLSFTSDFTSSWKKNTAIVGILLQAMKGCRGTRLVCVVADFNSTELGSCRPSANAGPSSQLSHWHSPITAQQLKTPNDYKRRNQSLFLHFVKIRWFPLCSHEILYVTFC